MKTAKTGKHLSAEISSILATIILLGFFQIAAAQHVDFTKLIPQPDEKSNLPPGWDYQSNTENPHAVIVVLEANPRINDIPIQPGDYIGAFYQDNNGELKCGGADFWTGTENIIFAVFGDDPATPEKDGFTYFETMHFKIFYQDNQKSYDVTSTDWDPSYYSTNIWSPLGISSAIDMQCQVEFDAYASVDNNPVCIGQSVNLEGHIFIETTGNYTWLWSSDPPGLNATTQTVSHTPGESTVYILEVSDGTTTSIHELPVTVYENPEVNPGEEITICIDQAAQVEATAENYASVLWETMGDGTFDNPEQLSAIYYPGINDKQNLSAEIKITAFPLDPCQSISMASKNVEMQALPTVTLPAQLEFCENQPVMVEATASVYNNIVWSTSGDGSFSDPNGLATQYFPGPSDLNTNEFELTVHAGALSPCSGSAFATVGVNTTDTPTISAPSSKTSCESNPVALNSIVFNYSSITWTTEGDGTFQNPAAPGTVYFPGPNDLAAGGTVVTIHAYGTGICQEFDVTRNTEIILLPEPISDAGDDTGVCDGGNIQLQGLAQNTTFIQWTTAGDGYFDNPYIATPVYQPGPADYSSGLFELYLTAYAIYPCTVPVMDTIKITVLPEPTIEIGLNSATICYDNNFSFSQTVASDYSSLEWFTVNGTGTFDDPTLMNPTYFPDPGHDYALGSVIIGTTAMPISPCTTQAYDYLTLNFEAPPLVDAGENDTIVQGENFVPDASAQSYSGVFWETGGDGTFNNPDVLSPIYTPGTNDIMNYGTTLTVTAAPLDECTTYDTDYVDLFIYRSQVIQLEEGENSFSSFIDFEDKTFEETIAPVADKVLFAQHFGQVYWPQYGINTMEGFTNSSGLRLVLDSDDAVQFIGFEVTTKTITLSSGWNILPVLSSCPVDVEVLSSQLGNALIMVAEMAGEKSYAPQSSNNSLQELLPGKAYVIKVATGEEFTFPGCEN